MKSWGTLQAVRGVADVKRWIGLDDSDPFFTAAPAGLVILDSDLRILKANETMAEMIGTDVAGILGKTPREVVPLLAPVVEPILVGVSKSGQSALNFPVSGETPKLPGVTRYWVASVFPMRGRKNGKWRIGAIAVEVTDQVQLDRLAKSQALLAQAEEIADLGSWEHDCLTGEETWSANLCRMMGRDPSKERVADADFWELLHPQDLEMVRNLIEWGMRERQPYEYQARVKHPDGREHVMYTWGKIGVDAGNQVVKRFGVTQDITARVEVERDLLKSEERYRDLVENSLDLICTHDLEGKILSTNEQPARMLGYPVERLVGQRIPDMLLPRYRGEFSEYIERIRMEGHAEGLMAVRTMKGEERIWEYRNTLRTEGVPEPIVRGAARDVTERVRVEKLLRESEALAKRHLGELNLIYHTAPIGLCFVDRNLRFVRINELLASINGRSVADHIGRTLREVLPELADQLEPMYESVFGSGEPLRKMEVRGTTPADPQTERVWEASLFPLRDEHNSILGCNVVVQDITEMKKAEDVLRQLSNQLIHVQDEERRRISRELHETMAQDLAALRMLLGQVQRAGHTLSTEARRTLDECMEMSNQTITQIRTLSYFLHPPFLEAGDIGSTISSYGARFSERSGIQAELDIPAEIGPIPLEYKTTLFRLVQECLTNVHRHSGSRWVRIRILRDNGRLSMEVEDHGKGLPVEASHSGRARLGLGIVGMRERVKQLHGKFQIESTPQKGVTVRVELPLAGDDFQGAEEWATQHS